MGISFIKMNGCGNDFIIIDNRKKTILEKDLSELAKKICKRRESLGADGILLLENSLQHDFKMRLFNSDGTEGEMCGNGARCIAEFAFKEGIANREMVFETLAGKIYATVRDQYVEVKLPDIYIDQMTRNQSMTIDSEDFIYTYLVLGVPHCVIFLEKSLPEKDLFYYGKKIRFYKQYFPIGTNVNFVEVEGDHQLFVRTYERGVEEITLSCGTGSLSSAVVYSLDKGKYPPFIVRTKGGNLEVNFVRDINGIKDIKLTGKVKMIARGELLSQSYNDD